MIISVNDGLTPYVGDNGYWFIGDEDTGVRANGQSTTTIETVALTAAGWSNLSQTVGCAGILADETRQVITVFPDMICRDAYMDSGITCTGVGANTLTFTADAAPLVNLIVYVAIEEAGQAPLDVYSTEEQVVGTWIDGKPIYRRTFVGAIATAANKDVVLINVALPLDTMIDIRGMVHRADNVREYIYGGNTHLYYKPNASAIMIYTDFTPYINTPLMIMTEYTKTTDTATIPVASAASLMNAYDEGVNEA